MARTGRIAMTRGNDLLRPPEEAGQKAAGEQGARGTIGSFGSAGILFILSSEGPASMGPPAYLRLPAGCRRYLNFSPHGGRKTKGNEMANLYYDKDADLGVDSKKEGRDYRLRLAGSRRMR